MLKVESKTAAAQIVPGSRSIDAPEIYGERYFLGALFVSGADLYFTYAAAPAIEIQKIKIIKYLMEALPV